MSSNQTFSVGLEDSLNGSRDKIMFSNDLGEGGYWWKYTYSTKSTCLSMDI